jgi:hypothetical protein
MSSIAVELPLVLRPADDDPQTLHRGSARGLWREPFSRLNVHMIDSTTARLIARRRTKRGGGKADRASRAPRNFAASSALDVSFQEVVHSDLTEEAEVAKASDSKGRTEWIAIRMRL